MPSFGRECVDFRQHAVIFYYWELHRRECGSAWFSDDRGLIEINHMKSFIY